MSVSSVNSYSPVTVPQPSVAAPPVPQVSDADRDGDSDAGRVRAATPPGVGGLVDKTV
jgi:hypothetical protein